MEFLYKTRKYRFQRYPESSNRSLRPWSAADELLLSYLEEEALSKNGLAIYNDRFGFLSTVLAGERTYPVLEYRSQERAIRKNLETNKTRIPEENFTSPLAMNGSVELGLIKVPKSTELFELYLAHLSDALTPEATVLCGFMTRNFSGTLIDIASRYFEDVSQSKAHKKARLLILKNKKPVERRELTNTLDYGDLKFRQYFGVFSSNHIDYATQFLLDHLTPESSENCVLDLASGNGVMARVIRKSKPDAEIHLVDDACLAIESSKWNIEDKNTFFHQNDTLEEFQSHFFDLIVTNPPFHFEFETNIDVALGLFKEARRCLKKEGRFLIVSNRHLNYKTHLVKLFEKVEVLAENEKFEVYVCRKA